MNDGSYDGPIHLVQSWPDGCDYIIMVCGLYVTTHDGPGMDMTLKPDTDFVCRPGPEGPTCPECEAGGPTESVSKEKVLDTPQPVDA